MAEATLLCGKRGSGKSLVAISKIYEYLDSGRLVATNLDLKLEFLLRPSSRAYAVRLPDFSMAADLENLPLGNPKLVRKGQLLEMGPGWSEDENGLLVIDECATFLNSRDWKANGRQELISWLVQSRKYGWDLLFLVQDADMLDKQIREGLFELVASVFNMGKMDIPLVGKLFRRVGLPSRLPAWRRVIYRYGSLSEAPVAYTQTFFSLARFYKAYNTVQVFSNDDGVKRGQSFSYLSSWHVKGRYMSFFALHRVALVSCLAFGAVGGYFIGSYLKEKSLRRVEHAVVADVPQKFSDVPVLGVTRFDGGLIVSLGDGRVLTPSEVKEDLKNGLSVRVGDVWFKKAQK